MTEERIAEVVREAVAAALPAVPRRYLSSYEELRQFTGWSESFVRRTVGPKYGLKTIKIGGLRQWDVHDVNALVERIKNKKNPKDGRLAENR